MKRTGAPSSPTSALSGRAATSARTPGFISITGDGPAAAGVEPGTPPVTAAEIREQWRSVLKAGARNMLDHLLAVYPAGVKRAGATEVMIHPVSLHE